MTADALTLTLACPHCGHAAVLGPGTVTSFFTHLTCRACGLTSPVPNDAFTDHPAWAVKSIRRGRGQVDAPSRPQPDEGGLT